MAGKPEGDMINAMLEFIAVHRAAEEESIDPKSIAIRVPKLDRSGNEENEHINAMLRDS